MNKKQKTATALFGIVAGVYVSKVVTEYRYLRMLENRFPEIPTKILWKAYSRMMKNALRGDYQDVDLGNDADCDLIFLQIAHEIQSSM